jgi:hypothetical protein
VLLDCRIFCLYAMQFRVVFRDCRCVYAQSVSVLVLYSLLASPNCRLTFHASVLEGANVLSTKNMAPFSIPFFCLHPINGQDNDETVAQAVWYHVYFKTNWICQSVGFHLKAIVLSKKHTLLHFLWRGMQSFCKSTTAPKTRSSKWYTTFATLSQYACLFYHSFSRSCIWI